MSIPTGDNAFLHELEELRRMHDRIRDRRVLDQLLRHPIPMS